MNRKLLLLDLVLVGVVAWMGIQFRNEWRAARAREAAAIEGRPKPLPNPPFTPLPAEPPVMASGYVNIPDKMLWDRSRNSTVVVEVPPPPPPKPMPALPVYHGMMTLGGSTTAFFSLTAEAPHQGLHVGDTIGQFKLLSVNSDEIDLEWDGQTVRRTVAELRGHPVAPAPQAAAEVRTETPPPVTAAPPPVKSGPGEMTAFGSKTCSVNDGNADGTVIDGFKKVVHTNPFGTNCTWEPVGK
ncbi:MAG TPA: hypothetical protein VMH81_16160 [Bryobacteraceae bacterium]|nr:hypothetical protein [Bryobacteraceae bacterium]